MANEANYVLLWPFLLCFIFYLRTISKFKPRRGFKFGGVIPLKFASEQHRSQREVDLFMSELNKIPHDKLRSVSGLQLTSSELLGRRPGPGCSKAE